MQTIQSKLSKAGVDVVVVSADNPEALKVAKEKEGLDFPLLSDTGLELIDHLDLRHEMGNPIDGTDIARPALVLVDASGVVLKTQKTENYRVRPTPGEILEWVQ